MKGENLASKMFVNLNHNTLACMQVQICIHFFQPLDKMFV